MNKSSRYLRNTMTKATALQGRYNALGASPYQNVRNPMPMHQLVLTVLPTLPLPSAVIPVHKATRITALGKSFVKHSDDKAYAIDALGHSYWEGKALSVDEIVAKLQAKGFIVQRGTVAMALNSGRYSAGVASIRCQKTNVTDLRGSSYCRYFLAA